MVNGMNHKLGGRRDEPQRDDGQTEEPQLGGRRGKPQLDNQRDEPQLDGRRGELQLDGQLDDQQQWRRDGLQLDERPVPKLSRRQRRRLPPAPVISRV